jgi:imidazolonepropionase-like amidohydrolase
LSKGRISRPEFVRLTASNAARIYGLAPRKGDLAVGADADLLNLGRELRGPLPVSWTPRSGIS